MLAYIGLGSNLGDRASYLTGAVEALLQLDPRLEVSPVYETAPVGGPEGQGPYLNCVVRLRTDLSPRELLATAQQLETDAHRVRGPRNGPRTLDADLLLLDDLELHEDDLVVPHPRMYERAFVLAPLEDLDPALVPADWRRSLVRPGAPGYDLHKVGTLLPS
ncbi:MAG: 2-amino-4-hydroxy-6-hydroxymethyldihydropteridine diphosphokinase [Acidimicrobiales bacterium]